MHKVLLAVALAVVVPACSNDGADVAARDRCEATAGVGRCVKRHGKWLAIGSIDGTSTTATTAAGSRCRMASVTARSQWPQLIPATRSSTSGIRAKPLAGLGGRLRRLLQRWSSRRRSRRSGQPLRRCRRDRRHRRRSL